MTIQDSADLDPGEEVNNLHGRKQMASRMRMTMIKMTSRKKMRMIMTMIKRTSRKKMIMIKIILRTKITMINMTLTEI